MSIHTSDTSRTHARSRPIAGIIAGIGFAAFPLLRPWGDKSGDPTAVADAFASPLWVIAHLCGMVAWCVLVVAAWTHPARSPNPPQPQQSPHRSSRATGFLALGTAALLPFFGAETFALHVIGSTAVDQADLSLLDLESGIRNEPTAMTLFGVGLLAVAIGAALLARETWRHGTPQWAGIPMAVLVALYLPQFFAPDALRITHGVLLGTACVLWAVTSSRAAGRTDDNRSSSGPGIPTPSQPAQPSGTISTPSQRTSWLT